MEQLSPCAATTEARKPGASAPQQEKLPQLEGSPSLLQPEKAYSEQQRPIAAKNKHKQQQQQIFN